MSDYNALIKQLAHDWDSGIELLRLKRDLAAGVEEDDDECFGCFPEDFKSNDLNRMYNALNYWEARGYSNEKQHTYVYCGMLTELETSARCMEDTPGPEDAQFSKRDDTYDALKWTADGIKKFCLEAAELRAYAYAMNLVDLSASTARTETVYYNSPGNPTPSFGEPAMSTTSLSFTTINYVSVNGTAPIDLSKLPADNIFSLIEQTEAEIKRLSEIANKPKALVARIESLQSGIERLVAEVDGRGA